MTPAHRELLQELQSYAPTAPTADALMEHIAKRLHEKMTRYNWTGFYLVDPADPGYLIVGPYAGSFTPNARFPLNTGLCGAAATSGQVVVVQNVTADPRYLAGSSLEVGNRRAYFGEEKACGRAGYRKLFRRHLYQSRTRVCGSLRPGPRNPPGKWIERRNPARHSVRL
jgi:hypothetical protein